MAANMGIDPATLMGWETERHLPTEKSLDVIGRVLQIRERRRVGQMATADRKNAFLDVPAFAATALAASPGYLGWAGCFAF